MILLAGRDSALLEGLAQALAHTGHRVAVAHSADEAAELREKHLPILAVVERGLVYGGDAALSFARGAIAAGTALVTFHGASDVPDPGDLAPAAAGPGIAQSDSAPAMADSRPADPGIGRHVLADLILPLERNRLAALAEHLASRARTVGRARDVTPPEPTAS